MLFAVAAQAAPTIDVGLYHGRDIPWMVVSCAAGVRVLDQRSSSPIWDSADGVRLAAGGDAFALSAGASAPSVGVFARMEAVRVVARNADAPLELLLPWASTTRVRYPGELRARRDSGQLRLINRAPLEDYVAGALAAEVPQSWRPEALRALAVCVRTYAVANLGRHAAEGFDLCSYAHCQAYHGLSEVRPSALDAARSTAGLVITYAGRPIQATHHACCGGRTTANEAVWPAANPIAYLRGGWDAHEGRAFCRSAPEFEWSSDIPADDLLQALRADPSTDPGCRLTGVAVVARDETDRVTRLELRGERRRFVTGRQLWAVVRHHLGWHALPGTLFWVQRDGETFRFCGRGFGHGVGLCQWGAQGRALAGHTFAQILQHYYPGTKIGPHATGRR
jgi:stage II sporulation protein D